MKQKKVVFDPSLILPLLHQTFTEVLWKNNSLESRKRVVALIMRGWACGRSSVVISAPPTSSELVSAERIILATGMFDTAAAYHKGQLDSLLPESLEFLLCQFSCHLPELPNCSCGEHSWATVGSSTDLWPRP